MSFINGQIAEELVASQLRKCGIEVKSTKGKVPEYDLICKLKRKKFTIEVKYDLYSSKSGNLAIEYWNCKQDKPSGINVSTANLWVYVLPDNGHPTTWVTKLDNLISYTNKYKPLRTIERAGDGNANLYLYSLDDILTVFDRFDNLPSADVLKLVRKSLK